MIRTAALAGLALLVAAAAGCKRASTSSPAAKESCRRELSKDELYRLQERIQKGETVCPELTAPILELESGSLRLDGEPLAGSLPTTSITRFVPLFDKLKSGRETWKMLHTGEDFRPTLRLVAGGEASAFAGASVVATAAFAGYPSIELSAGEKRLSFEYAVVRPPLDPEPPEPSLQLFGRIEVGVDRAPSDPALPAPEELTVAARPGVKVNVRFAGRPTPRVGLDETVSLSELGALLSKECNKTKTACADTLVVEVGAGPFHEAVQLAHAVFQAPAFVARRPKLAFETAKHVPKIVGKLAPSKSSKPSKPSKIKIRFGVLSLAGPLAKEPIEQVLRDGEPAFRACYERGLASNPHLQGRVSVRFVIGRDGSVWSPNNAGSDLPDLRTVWCILHAYRGLSFPRPPDTTVTVVSPLLFTPE